MDVEVRFAGPGEMAGLIRVAHASWGHRATEHDIAEGLDEAEPGRTLGAFEGGEAVGVARGRSVELTLPNRPEPVAVCGLTDVGVLPTHRRRGILTALLARHLDDCRERGEAGLVLDASEGGIYGRFGYGVAAVGMAVEVDCRRAAFRRPPAASADLRLLGPEECDLLLPEVYDRYRRSQPGELSRSRWEWYEGFVVAHENGYAAYRVDLLAARVTVDELVAADPEVRAVLWRYLLDLDLITTVAAPNVPVDEPLRWLLADPRAMRTTGTTDVLWLRLASVPGVDESLVLEVDGERYVASGQRTEALPDLSLGVADLATLVTGAASATTLARAGRLVEHTPGAIGRADRVYATSRAPHAVASP